MTVRPSRTLTLGCVLFLGGMAAQFEAAVSQHPFVTLAPVLGAACISIAVARWPGLGSHLGRARHRGGWTATKS